MDIAEQFVLTCRRYGVTILECATIPTWQQGPRGVGCEVESRAVLVPQTWRNAVSMHDMQQTISAEPENYIHELAHVLCQPPDCDIEQVPEDWMLLQFERQLTRYAMPAALDRVLRWQMDTELQLCGTGGYLGDFAGYRRDPAWQRGFMLARKVGLLNARRRPTWRCADWSALTRAELRSWAD